MRHHNVVKKLFLCFSGLQDCVEAVDNSLRTMINQGLMLEAHQSLFLLVLDV